MIDRSKATFQEMNMTRTLSHTICAALAALALSAGAFAKDTPPLSVNESGPVNPQRATVHEAPVGATQGRAPVRAVGSGHYEVQTPSSVSESAPWLAGTQRR